MAYLVLEASTLHEMKKLAVVMEVDSSLLFPEVVLLWVQLVEAILYWSLVVVLKGCESLATSSADPAELLLLLEEQQSVLLEKGQEQRWLQHACFHQLDLMCAILLSSLWLLEARCLRVHIA